MKSLPVRKYPKSTYPKFSSSIPVADQADLLYISSHGDYTTGNIFQNYINVSVEDINPKTYWIEDLDVVTFSACKILNIKDLTGKYRPGVGDNGKKWADNCISGRNGGKGTIHTLCGYWNTAPSEVNGGSTGGITGSIASAYIQKLNKPGNSLNNASTLWMEANKPYKYGACAMTVNKYYYRPYASTGDYKPSYTVKSY